jgi:hypothetical protein
MFRGRPGMRRRVLRAASALSFAGRAALLAWAALLAGAGLLLACGGSEPTRNAKERAATSATLPEGRLPGVLSTNRGDGPALFLSSDPKAPAFGYVGDDVRVDLLTGVENGRVRVQTAGAMKVRGYIPVERLAARALRRGRVKGTPTYLAPGNVVGVRGAEGPWLTVAVRPGSRRLEQSGVVLPMFTGRFPAEFVSGGLGHLAAEPPRSGFRVRLPSDAPTEVFERPGGALLATIPAMTPPLEAALLKDEGEWKGIRFGDGPYLVGFVKVALSPVPEAAPPRAEDLAPMTTKGLPARLRVDADKPLWRVRAGARVRFGDVTVAKLEDAGYARELGRYPSGDVDAFVAVDEGVAVRGVVSEDDLEALTPPPYAPADIAPRETPGAVREEGAAESAPAESL